ncbi:ribonuclease 3 [Clostridium sp. CAG:242]|nr:ribonuclease 3 [Clostridium sp. CAG:242]
MRGIEEMTKSIQQLQDTIGYKFHNPVFLEVALTHSSYANEVKHQLKYNERQEFLGDAVLSIIVSDYLFNNYTVPEGELTKLRAAIVCEKSLDVMANKIHLGEYLRLGRGEEMTGGRTRPSIIADAFEALIAAIYLDSGIESARAFVLPFVTEMLEHEDSLSFKDYKTILQEIIQQNPEEKLVYKLVGEKGPDHDKRFVVDVMLNSNVIGKGEGRSKKNAEQMAAKEALELMGR